MNIITRIKETLAKTPKGVQPPSEPLFKGIKVQDRQILTIGLIFDKTLINAYLHYANWGDTRFLSAFKREVVQDPFISGEYEKIKSKLQNSMFNISPYPSSLTKPNQRETAEGKISHTVCEFVKQNLLDPTIDLSNAIETMLWGLMDGISALEIVSEVGPDGKERLKALTAVPSERFRYIQPTTTLGVQLTSTMNDLTPLEDVADHFVVMIADKNDPSPARRGILRKVLLAWLIRRYVMEWWARATELNGMPTRVARYPQSNQDIQKVLETLMRDSGGSSYMVIPDNVNLEFINSASSASNDLFKTLIETTNQSISIAMLGATQGTAIAQNEGSKASAQVHLDVILGRIEGYASQICSVLRDQLVKKMVARNFGEEIANLYTPSLNINVVGFADLQDLSVALKNYVAIGLPIGQSWVYEKTGIDQPEDSEPLLEAIQVPSLGGGSNSASSESASLNLFSSHPPSVKTGKFEEFTKEASSAATEAFLKPYLPVLAECKKDGADLGHLSNRIRHIAQFNGETKQDIAKIVEAVLIHATMTGYNDSRKTSNG